MHSYKIWHFLNLSTPKFSYKRLLLPRDGWELRLQSQYFCYGEPCDPSRFPKWPLLVRRRNSGLAQHNTSFGPIRRRLGIWAVAGYFGKLDYCPKRLLVLPPILAVQARLIICKTYLRSINHYFFERLNIWWEANKNWIWKRKTMLQIRLPASPAPSLLQPRQFRSLFLYCEWSLYMGPFMQIGMLPKFCTQPLSHFILN